MSAIGSSPPVLPPTRYTMPRPTPVVIPAIMELNKGSLIIMSYCKKLNKSTIQDSINVPYKVLITTRVPSHFQAAQNIGIFKIIFQEPTDKPVT